MDHQILLRPSNYAFSRDLYQHVLTWAEFDTTGVNDEICSSQEDKKDLKILESATKPNGCY